MATMSPSEDALIACRIEQSPGTPAQPAPPTSAWVFTCTVAAEAGAATAHSASAHATSARRSTTPCRASPLMHGTSYAAETPSSSLVSANTPTCGTRAPTGYERYAAANFRGGAHG